MTHQKRKNNSFKDIWRILAGSRNVLISLHYGPDGDSLASCAAMKYVLERDCDCNVRLISYDKLDETLMKSPYAKWVEFGTDVSDCNLAKYDVTMFLDSGAISGKLRDKYVPPRDAFIINIDHHATNKYNTTISYIDPSKPSTCSILVELFKETNRKFDKKLSSILLLGLCTDTNFFRQYDYKSSLGDAFFLIQNGGDYGGVVSLVLGSTPLRIKRYYAALIDRFKLIKIQGYNVGYSWIELSDIKAMKLNDSEVRLGARWLSDIDKCDLIFMLANFGKYVKGSFRSKGGIDVSAPAVALGGGGHGTASAFFVEGKDIKYSERKVLSVLKTTLPVRPRNGV